MDFQNVLTVEQENLQNSFLKNIWVSENGFAYVGAQSACTVDPRA